MKKLLVMFSALCLACTTIAGSAVAFAGEAPEGAEQTGESAGEAADNGESADEAAGGESAGEAADGESAGDAADSSETAAETVLAEYGAIDMSAWQYEESKDVYWQIGIQYCSDPADASYENLGIFVPGAYFTATDNGDGTYTCEINPEGQVGAYTVETAPYVIPVNTPGYSAQSAPTKFVSEAATFAEAGIIYIGAGNRGRDEGAPAGVTDLKAAIRYIREYSDLLPGNTDAFFSFGHSGGGAQSSLLGVTGDNELYTPYLEAIGAVMDTSDAVMGAMCWCPITNLDTADEAYEWNMGLAREDLDDTMLSVSKSLAGAYAEYLNALGLVDEEGNALTLSETEDGYYQSGSYYDYMIKVVETSLNNFLEDTEFPYTVSSAGESGGGPGPGGPSAQTSSDDEAEDEVYDTPADYVASLNEDAEWVTYDEATGKASVLNLEGFAKVIKNPSKSVGAFDTFDLSSAENTLFGDAGTAKHFDSILTGILEGTEYYDEFAADMDRTDALGTTLQQRIDMYTPMYYLCDYYGYDGESTVAHYWRINSGITQGDTSLCVETNLALALEALGNDVDFTTVWAKGHTQTERTGNSTTNFIAWVEECMTDAAAE